MEIDDMWDDDEDMSEFKTSSATTHDRDKIIALREEADKFATNELSCEGEYHPDFHTISDERFYAIAFEEGRQVEREDCAKVCEDRLAIHNQNYGGFIGQSSTISEAHQCAKAIHARSTK